MVDVVADCSLVDLDLVDLALVEALTDVDLALVEALTETESDVDLVLVEAVTAEVDLVGLVLVCFFLPPLGCFFSFSFFCSLLCLYIVTKSSSVMQTAMLL